MSAFGAMIMDSYRELNAKKLFWVTVLISLMVTVIYASIGFDENGMFFFFGVFDVENEFLVKGSPMAKMLYRTIFSTFMVGLWLAWIATILAIISTTTVFPDFIAGGSIDLVLSKPISRLSLFIMKYLSSLLFVILQVSLFCVGVFICMGWRAGDWNPMIFAAIPVVTVFFTYLFSFNVLVGVVSRSALAALLLTLLFWFSIWSLEAANAIMEQQAMSWTIQLEDIDEQIAGRTERIEQAGGEGGNPAGTLRTAAEIDNLRDERERVESAAGKLDRWHRPIGWVLTILPKNDGTIGLVERWLKDDRDVSFVDLVSGNIQMNEDGEYVPVANDANREVMVRMEEEYYSTSPWYLIGSSLVFELVLLSIAAFVFVRRDY